MTVTTQINRLSIVGGRYRVAQLRGRGASAPVYAERFSAPSRSSPGACATRTW